jgi:hypothetical protein
MTEQNDNLENQAISEEYLQALIDETKDYINDLLVCLEREDYEMLVKIEETYDGLLDDLDNLPDGATDYYPEEWELIGEQLSDLRDIMEERRDSLLEFIERTSVNGAANKAYMRNMDFDDDIILGDAPDPSAE